MKAQTLAYFPPHEEGMHISAFPEINGMHCYKWSASDVFEEREDAYTLLAKIATGSVGYGEAEDLAKAFFKERNEEPYSYYDPDENESDDEEP